MSNTGKEFEEEIRQSLKMLQSNKRPIFFWRVMDFKSYNTKPVTQCCHLPVIMLCPRCKSGYKSPITAPKSPADFLVVWKTAIFLEAKSTVNHTSFRTKHKKGHIYENTIKPHQLQMGLETETAGGKYYFLINKRVKRKNELFAFSSQHWAEIQAKLDEGGKKSIKWDELNEYIKNGIGKKIELKKGKIWNLAPLIFGGK